jgi:tetratricopeptide (TPR) repeat protein
VERRVLLRITSILVISLAEASVSSEALAQTSAADKRARAETLNKEAAADIKAGSYASACPKLKEVVDLVPNGIGAKMSLAACYEQWGRLASAMNAYRLAEQAAGNAKDAREKEAHKRAEVLQEKTAKLTLTVPAEVEALPGLELTCDGEDMVAEWWNNPMPIDKGPHVLRAFLGGKQVWTRNIELVSDGIRAWITVSKPRDVEPVKPTLP